RPWTRLEGRPHRGQSAERPKASASIRMESASRVTLRMASPLWGGSRSAASMMGRPDASRATLLVPQPYYRRTSRNLGETHFSAAGRLPRRALHDHADVLRVLRHREGAAGRSSPGPAGVPGPCQGGAQWWLGPIWAGPKGEGTGTPWIGT